MSIEASSEQLCVRKGAGYDEVSGQGNPGAFYPERVPFANSPFEEEDEDWNKDRSESDINGVSNNKESEESSIKIIMGPDGLRNFVLPLILTVNDFCSTIQSKHFNTLQDRYQIPVDVPLCLPFKFDKCYYCGVDDVRVYEKMFKAGFRLPLSALHHCLV